MREQRVPSRREIAAGKARKEKADEGERESENERAHIHLPRLLRQYLHFCTSKASKLR
jgi:hypothetical protein